ncbi:MAG: hypothetical protein PHC75_10060, partial [Burkholderiales bacterium]|nr:hypothetical protein [Burkholderiales bacterium]
DMETNKTKYLAEKVRDRIKININTVKNEYTNLHTFSSLAWYKDESSELENIAKDRCKAVYWDGKAFEGKCGHDSFIIPNVNECKSPIEIHGHRIYCPVLNFHNVDKFAPGSAGSDASRSATDGMLETWSDYAYGRLYAGPSFIAVEYDNGRYSMGSHAYYNFEVDRFSNMELEGSQMFFNEKTNKKCFDSTISGRDKANSGMFPGLFSDLDYSRTMLFDPSSYHYLFMLHAAERPDKKDVCLGGVTKDIWWNNGSKISWNDVEQLKSIQRTYVNIKDTATSKSFMIPTITKYDSHTMANYPSFTYFTTLGCTTSDCVILDMGGLDKKKDNSQRQSVIAWLEGNLELSNDVYTLYAQHVENNTNKGAWLNNKPVLKDGVFANKSHDDGSNGSGFATFVLNKNGFNVKSYPLGDWIYKCNGISFKKGAVASAIKCNIGGAEGKDVINSSLDWVHDCLPGSPIDVDANSNLVCRYPRGK